MTSSNSVTIGRREVTPAAVSALADAAIECRTLFARHENGDWGGAPEWLRTDNNRAAGAERSSHAIQSHYVLPNGTEIYVVSAADRSRTRMMVKAEFTLREIGVQEGYAVWARSYDGVNPLVAVEEPVVDRLLARLPAITSAFDVGTGTGRIARKLARMGIAEVVGVDATPEMLVVACENAAREGLHNIRFELAVLGEAPLPGASNAFDLVTCGLMICDVPDLRRAVAECIRLVRPGGWLLLTDFHPATCTFGWRTDFVTPEGRLLLPNTPSSRQHYLDAIVEAGASIREVQDIALDGKPYGDTAACRMNQVGLPPLCLVILAQKTAG